MPVVRSGSADIAYYVAGSGDPLLLIMGFLGDSRMWVMQTPAFSQSHRVITFDNRGVGGSSSPPGPFTMEEMAADALAVLDAAGAERAHVLGISMGGAIAQHLALKAPERVRSLVLAATWCSKNPYLERLSEVGALIASTDGGHTALARASMLWLFTPGFIIGRPEMVSMIENLALQFPPPPDAFAKQAPALLEHDTRDRLSELRARTLVMVGRRDVMVPPELSEELAAAIPGAELRLLEAGHAFNVEEAEAFNRHVLDFLAGEDR
ncbi:MAG: alpha/beta fold hydrolase [Acidobacteria bacterium]|nr:alpha/beta fold hydrolase [Acidobacteriota bacterium]